MRLATAAAIEIVRKDINPPPVLFSIRPRDRRNAAVGDDYQVLRGELVP
jgi:hypothetical protein